MLVNLQAHIVSAPKWWKDPSDDIGGMSLPDYEPILELNRLLVELQKPVVVSAPVETPAP